ncbi:flavin reductase (DIM6/NTAB) family NADH-FMN oxidoreductase RutF [Chromobacterium alkanivorans]|uniref:p-hydroxyphenylacetate 3-hydroxylase reductase component n=1 Tax=Chromobacterium alkanivorans TaxID=1071719 RepID=UPI002166F5A1|nr:flavin reductase [Chromobacterium alkanivorans]MCS3804469.1 flavin reductase (DIM6/NTAB) family NADH-FMN oxidoreductase RutF [Chromobacterium alkanivorans]MCS3818808.1 flavin reductase (DIM6/NTAB) family NADH-FMN oxidoreductase RutF [Chromobacterium alkanivorans]MCS3873334.1 flavin reductase (DIM6/NTAB) family NADH-FMN oxidoreductase RutF [Chromobacterium alkanivorans]
MNAPAPAHDARALRRALGNFATGVTVVTASSPDGERAGVTANSFNSVSLDPPLVLWSLDKRSASNAVFDQAGHFVVHVLAADQIELSNRFARAAADKFAGLTPETGRGGAPLLDGCAARFHCRLHQRLDGGDHWILLGLVEAFDDGGAAPLLYHQGMYAAALPRGRPEAAEPLPGWLGDNLLYLLTQALQAYQVSYRPRQLAAGLGGGEARLLLVLEQQPGLDACALQREAALPPGELELAEAELLRKGLLTRDADGYRLSAAGREQAATLWRVAQRQQQDMQAGLDAQDLAACKRALRALIRQT